MLSKVLGARLMIDKIETTIVTISAKVLTLGQVFIKQSKKE